MYEINVKQRRSKQQPACQPTCLIHVNGTACKVYREFALVLSLIFFDPLFITSGWIVLFFFPGNERLQIMSDSFWTVLSNFSLLEAGMLKRSER